MSRILPLPAETVSQIHSYKNIASLQGAVLALLENSVDAGSNKIEITVDFRRGGCTVEDNGSGIPPGEFLEHGGLGRMYHTSKHAGSSRNELHGSTGTYLASLSALSLLSISSHHVDYDQQATLTIHQGKVIARRVPAPPAQEISPSIPHGTRVTVRDLFGNMPVRVKQRDLAANESNDNEKAWFEVKHGIVALLLAWPKPCAVRLRDAEAESRVLHLSGVHPTVNASLTKHSLERLSGKTTKFDLKDVLPVLSQAGLAPVESRGQWIPVSAFTPKVSVKGAICLDPAPTKQCQFISIGIHPCSISSGNNAIYDAINKLFNNSGFGAVDDTSDVDEMEKDRRKRDRRFKSDGYTQKQLHGRKGVDRWPMFVLQIRFVNQTSRAVEAERMSESNLKAIVDVSEATITQWLAANHFRPRKPRRRKREDVHSPAEDPSQTGSETPEIRTLTLQKSGDFQSATTSKKRKYVDIAGNTRIFDQPRQAGLHSPNHYFSSWSRIKSGKGSFYDQVWQEKKPATAPAEQTGTEIASTEEHLRPVFNLSVLEAGELSSKKTAPRKFAASHSTTAIVPVREAYAQRGDNPSSEDYGSIDDHAMLTAVGSVGQLVNGLVQSDTNPGDDEVVSSMANNVFNDAVMDWTDPVTKQTFKVNARTGVVLPSRPKSSVSHTATEAEEVSANRHTAGINTSVSSTGHPLSLARHPTSSKQNMERWLPGFLKVWNNPVFAQQEEERIPTTSFGLSDMHAIEAESRRHTHDSRTTSFTEVGASVTSNLSKVALKDARVIKQVDQKYILCRTQTPRRNGCGETLILIDQHAASERVILEGLLAELCSPDKAAPGQSRSKEKNVRLEKPVRFQISEAESRQFHDHAQHFADWGILYELTEKEEVLSASQFKAPKREFTIIIQYLPIGIAERCVLVPRLLIELLRSEAWRIAESAKKPKTPFHSGPKNDYSEGEHGWLKRLGSCPKGILDMLNSRACRSAIMFNDELSIAQCQQLLSDLSKCAFPFMCAHGRVSMVPLIETDTFLGGENGAMLEVSPDKSFTKAFCDWMGKDREDSMYMRSRS